MREVDAERARARCKGRGDGKERQRKDVWGHTGERPVLRGDWDQDEGRDVQAAGLGGKRAEVSEWSCKILWQSSAGRPTGSEACDDPISPAVAATACLVMQPPGSPSTSQGFTFLI